MKHDAADGACLGVAQPCPTIMSDSPPPAMHAAGSEDDASEQKPAVSSRTPSASTPDSAQVAANVFVQVGPAVALTITV